MMPREGGECGKAPQWQTVGMVCIALLAGAGSLLCCCQEAKRCLLASEQVEAAKRWRVPAEVTNDLGMRFVILPRGPDGLDGDLSELRATSEAVLYVMVTEVTNRQFRLFRANHCSVSYGSFSLDGGDQPVVNVTWYDAVEFGAWLTGRERGRKYRLPTEAEWVLMCRAGRDSGRKDDVHRCIEKYANLSDRLDPTGPERPDLADNHAVTAPVGSYLPNRWGVFDALGNAAEWCSDWYAPLSGDAEPSTTGPTFDVAPDVRIFHGTGGTDYRIAKAKVVRGGSWASDVSADCGGRHAVHPDYSTNELGFRLILEVSLSPRAE